MSATFRGPIFNGQAMAAVREMAAEMEQQFADEGVRLVRANLAQVLQHPTGYYESHIDASPVDGDWEVSDSGVVYGPWLEGVGSRNKTTRFKGYATFRRTAQELERRAPELARRVAVRYVRRMG